MRQSEEEHKWRKQMGCDDVKERHNQVNQKLVKGKRERGHLRMPKPAGGEKYKKKQQNDNNNMCWWAGIVILWKHVITLKGGSWAGAVRRQFAEGTSLDATLVVHTPRVAVEQVLSAQHRMGFIAVDERPRPLKLGRVGRRRRRRRRRQIVSFLN